MAASRRDISAGVDDSAGVRAGREDHRWLQPPLEDDEEPERDQVKVGRARVAKVGTVRGASRRKPRL